MKYYRINIADSIECLNGADVEPYNNDFVMNNVPETALPVLLAMVNQLGVAIAIQRTDVTANNESNDISDEASI